MDLLHSPNNNLWPVAQFFLNDLSNLEQANRLQLVQVNGFSVPRILWWVLKQVLCIWDLLHSLNNNLWPVPQFWVDNYLFWTYSTLYILHWDLFPSFIISLWTNFTIIDNLLHSLIFFWIACQIWNKQIASLMCGSFHASSKLCSVQMTWHIWYR